MKNGAKKSKAVPGQAGKRAATNRSPKRGKAPGNPRGAGRPRERAGSQTREALREAARCLFARQGFERVKVSDLVARAGVSQGSFYYHFEDKEAVLLEVLEQFFERGRALSEQWARTEDTGAETILAFARTVATLIHENRDVIRIMSGEAVSPDSRAAALIREFYADLYEQTAQAMRLGIRLGAVRPCDERIAAVAHIGMIKEVVLERLASGREGKQELDRVMGELMGLIYHGIRPPGESGTLNHQGTKTPRRKK